MTTRPRDQFDYGWWALAAPPLWRLSWSPDDGWLRLFRGGSDELVIRLARFDHRYEVDEALDGWADSFGEGTWLTARFPALAPYTRLGARV